MGKHVIRAMIASVAALMVAFIMAPHARADFGVSEFEAGTCATNSEAAASGQCTYDTPERFYTQAAGYPNYGIIDFTFNTAGGVPEGRVQNVRTDLPIGLSVNPEAVPKCTEEQLTGGPVANCPAESKVGDNYVTAVIPPGVPVTLPVPVYNMVPPDGKPLMAAFRLAVPPLVDETVYLVGDVEWDGDYHQFFTISDIGDTLPILRNRLVFDGQANDDGVGPAFIRMPTQCSDGETSRLAVSSHANPDDFLHYSATTPVGVDGCESVPFGPRVAVNPTEDQTDSPTGVTVDVNVPSPEGGIASADVRNVSIQMPQGMSLNPSATDGLRTCSDSRFGKGTSDPINCPAASKLGSASIETPVLPAGSLTGSVYAGEPLSNDPASGEQFRLFIDATSERFGVSVRLVGGVEIDPDTGRLTAVFEDLPQAPFSRFRVKLDAGPEAVLSTPTTCGPHRTVAMFAPWSGEEPTRSTDSFTLSQAPGGGDCAEHRGDRPFDPEFSADMSDRTSGNFGRLNVSMSREDGEQEFKGVDLTLPAGLTARIAGIEYCPEDAIADSTSRDGLAEGKSASCPTSSYIGWARLAVGTGPDPIHVLGRMFLAGPYAGAPLSMVVITPAVAGPYDLGTVAVRVALHINPETLEIRADSDPIPHMQRGVNFALRSIDLMFDRGNFNLNPTACWEKFFHGTIWGGGVNPANPDMWQRNDVLQSYQATGCERLEFNPRVYTRMFGPPGLMGRNGHPSFRTVLRPIRGNANIRRAAVALPRAVQLDQSNIKTVCTRDQFAADECPRESIYGVAAARSPLIEGQLRGPVYLRSSDNVLPDLVARLRGQIEVVLGGRIDSVKRRIRTAYTFVPDVPVEHFALRLFGGPRGLLVNSKSLCARRTHVASWFRGHNTKQKGMQTKLRVPCRKRQAR